MARLLADKPSFHGDGHLRWDVSPGTLRLLARLARPGHTTLEVGCGASTVVFAAVGSNHVAVSPAPAEFAGIRRYCAEIGVDTSSVSYVEGYSDRVLPTLEGRFNLALIDGAHSFPYPAVDFQYVSRRLEVGGLLVLDDLPIPSVGSVYRFLVAESAWRLLEVVEDRAAAFRLVRPLATGDPWGDQGFNHRYPDFSFLPWGRRVRVETVERLARSRLAGEARRRIPNLDRATRRLRQLIL